MLNGRGDAGCGNTQPIQLTAKATKAKVHAVENIWMKPIAKEANVWCVVTEEEEEEVEEAEEAGNREWSGDKLPANTVVLLTTKTTTRRAGAACKRPLKKPT